MSQLYFSQQTQPAGQLFNIVVSDPESKKFLKHSKWDYFYFNQKPVDILFP